MPGLTKTIVKYLSPKFGFCSESTPILIYRQVNEFQYFTIRLPTGEKFY